MIATQQVTAGHVNALADMYNDLDARLKGLEATRGDTALFMAILWGLAAGVAVGLVAAV